MFNNKAQSFIEYIIIVIIGTLCLFAVLGKLDEARHQRLKEEQLVVSKVIASEACGEGPIGMYLVANTIANRAKRQEKTPYEIVTWPNQYNGLTNPKKEELLFMHLRNDKNLPDKCNSCENNSICWGCRAAAFYNTGDICGIDPNCYKK